jgi:EpsG family
VFPYWLIFTLFAAGAVQYRPDFRRPLQGGPFLWTMALVMTLFVGLRYDVGGDWLNYIDILRDIGYRDFWDGVWKQDPGYGLLNWIVARAGLGVWAVNLVCAALFAWGMMKFARHQPNPWLVFVVAVPYLIIVVAMGYVRQGVAIGFIVAGLSVLDRGMLRFLVYMALAASFHKSAVVVLPFVALSATQRRIVTAGIGLVSVVLLYYLFIQASVDKLMTNYVEAGYASQGAGIRVAMNLPPAILFLLFHRRFVTDEQERKLWRNFSLAALAALVLLALTSSTTAVDRLALYLIPLQMFVLARVPEAFSDKQRSSLGLTLAIVFYSAAIQFVWLTYADNAEFWLPYQWYPTATDE